MATSQFSAFGLGPGAYVLTPAAYSALPARTTGFPAGLLPKENLNTPLRQASSISTMIANFIAANQGDDVMDDGDLAALLEQFGAALLAYTGTQATHYQLASSGGAANARSVVLTPGTWQMTLFSLNTFVDPGNYDFFPSQTASVVGSLVNMSVTASYRVVRGGGAGFGRSVFPVLAGVNSMVVPSTDNFTMTISSMVNIAFMTCMGTFLTVSKIG